MTPHRKSYWKTTLISLGATVSGMIVIGYWQIAGEIRIPATSVSITRSAIFFCAIMVLTVIFTLLFLLITAGGIICLRGDAQEGKSD